MSNLVGKPEDKFSQNEAQLDHLTFCLIFLHRFVLAMVFYGLALNLGNLGGDLYLNYLISSLIEYVAYTICVFAILKMNRRSFHCTSMMLGGIACVVTLFPAVFGKEGLYYFIILISTINLFL